MTISRVLSSPQEQEASQGASVDRDVLGGGWLLGALATVLCLPFHCRLCLGLEGERGDLEEVGLP